MSSNKSNNLYNLENERKRLEELRRQRNKQMASAARAPFKAKLVLYGQVAFFLIMVGLLMYQCQG